MKNQHTIASLKGRVFNGTYSPKIERIHQEPRQKICQLLRSFIPLNQPESTTSIFYAQNGRAIQKGWQQSPGTINHH
jgi:hypothetical protein